MTLQFKVEYVQKSKTVAIIARQLQQRDFSVGDKSLLGGCRIQKELSQPRALKPDGTPDFDLFVFYLADGNDRDKFVLGKEVQLVP